MKKKFDEALAEFNEFGKTQQITEDEQILEEILPKYRAFSFFSLCQYQVILLL